MSRRLMSLICLGMYCLCLWLAVQTVEKVRQISPGVSLRYAQALTGEQVKKAQTYILCMECVKNCPKDAL